MRPRTSTRPRHAPTKGRSEAKRRLPVMATPEVFRAARMSQRQEVIVGQAAYGVLSVHLGKEVLLLSAAPRWSIGSSTTAKSSVWGVRHARGKSQDAGTTPGSWAGIVWLGQSLTLLVRMAVDSLRHPRWGMNKLIEKNDFADALCAAAAMNGALGKNEMSMDEGPVRSLLELAKDLVRTCWSEIMAVASALDEQGSLPGRRIVEVMARAEAQARARSEQKRREAHDPRRS